MIQKEFWNLLKAKRLPEAELLLRDALQQFLPGSYENTLIKTDLADIVLRLGKSKEAKEIALEVLSYAPNHVKALTVLGLAALENRETEEAVENLKRAYELNNNSYQAGRLARAYEQDGKMEKALQILQEALKGNPNDQHLLKQYSALKRKSRKIPDEDEIISRFSQKEETSLPYAEYLREQLGQLEPQKAVLQLQKIIKVGNRKENPHLHILLGDLLRRLEKENQAAEAYRKALELDPENLYALTQQAFCYRRLGEKEKAWLLLKMLLSKQPGNTAAKSALVKDAVELEKLQEAIDFFEELLLNFPQHKELYGPINKLKKHCRAAE